MLENQQNKYVITNVIVITFLNHRNTPVVINQGDSVT